MVNERRNNIHTFRDLRVWQRAHELVLLTYKITLKFPKHELYGLVSQMRRAALSIASNIVEGFHRRTVKDSVHFYNTSSASLEELRYHYLVSFDLKYIDESTYKIATSLLDEVGRLLYRWSESQNNNSSRS